MRVIAVGERACVVEVPDAVAAASLAAWARSSGLPAEEVVPGATTVLFDGIAPSVVEAALPRWVPGGGDAPWAREGSGDLRRP